MIISIIQPCFIPWLGYFEQIAVGDIFLYLDDVQYTKKDWRNNNQLKSPNGIKNVYVPVQSTHRDTLINQVLISYNEKWEDSLINKITQWYKKAPFFSEVLQLIQEVIYHKHEKLVGLNFELNNAILKYTGIQTPIYFSSDITKSTDDKNQRIVELCKHFDHVDMLYDGKSAQNFIDVNLFHQNGIEVVFQEYQHSPYKQLWGEFIPYMSVIDLLMNYGKDSLKIILSGQLPESISNRIKSKYENLSGK
jgi:hypothetical protein